MNNKIELLAPAGNMDSLIAAVQNGADAVYLGGKRFNARINASNFDDETLKKVVQYCHIRDIRVHLTLNTLLSDAEFEELKKYIVYINNIGIDAVIVQDLGVAKLIRMIAPELDLHASTQMTVHSIEGVKFLQEIGFNRVILSRELSCDEIKYICENSEVEIEVFIHGALCICYSGQCLMSSFIGGRSGNRGSCAQPCRLPYKIIDIDSKNIVTKSTNNEYLLSPKDMCMIKYLETLKSIGVKSLKIEGRMKRPEYVAVVTNIYRKYLDSGNKEINQDDYNELLQIFNRGGFTAGYFEGKKGKNMMSYVKPNNTGIYAGDVISYDKVKNIMFVRLRSNLNIGDGIEILSTKDSIGMVVKKLILNNKKITNAHIGQIVGININGQIKKGYKVYKTSDIKLIEKARCSYMNDTKKIPVDIYCELNINSPIYINMVDDSGNFVEYNGTQNVEKAVNKSLNKQTIINQIKKLGNTPFEARKIKVNIHQNNFLPISEINNARRQVCRLLIEERLSKYEHNYVSNENIVNKCKQYVNESLSNLNNCKTYLSVLINDYYQFQCALQCEVNRIYVPAKLLINRGEKYIDIIKACILKKIEIVCVLPRILRHKDKQRYYNLINQIKVIGINKICVDNLGEIYLMKDFENFNIVGDFSLNVYNSFTAIKLKELGLKEITLSPELNLKQITKIKKTIKSKVEIIGYGRLPLMVMENCPVGSWMEQSNNVCDCKNKRYGLLDRKGKIFPLLPDKYTHRVEVLNSQPVFILDKIDNVLSSGVDYIRLMFTDENPRQCQDIIKAHKYGIKMGSDNVIHQYNLLISNIKDRGFTRGKYFK